MHNLPLGSAKHVLKTWTEMRILSESDLEREQKRVSLVKSPSEIVCIQSKISKGFKGFTSDQWKNWVCIYSFFALKGVIPSGHNGMWTAFVHACQLLCRKVITKEECMEADHKLMQFCVMFRSPLREGEVHTKHASSWPFQGLHSDYGPVFSFWCFSFERYNGIMGDYHTNNVNIGRY